MDFIPLIHEFATLGCTEQLKASVAARIYQDIKLDPNYLSTDKCYDPSLEIVFLRAIASNNTTSIILPLPDNGKVNFKAIAKFQKKYCDSGQKLVLAICDPSSNILYYQLNLNEQT
ncbi:tRNA splicing endonuclease subunit 15 isoform X2 [Musca autumnalis]